MPAEDDDGPRERLSAPGGGRFEVPHRDGTKVEVGEAVNVGGERPWLCTVKLVARPRPVVDDLEDLAGEHETTQTLLVRTGRGDTAEDARRDALNQLTLLYGSPLQAPPTAVIVQKPSDPPPPMSAPEAPAAAPASGWLSRLMRRLRGRS